MTGDLGSSKLLAMNLKDWLNAERGRHKALAEHLGVSAGRVTQMADRGVSTKYMLCVQAFTKGAVTLQEMVSQRTPDGKQAKRGSKSCCI